MKKTLLLIFAAAILSSCDFMSVVRNRDTVLNLQLLDLGGNYLYAQVDPEDDYTLYYPNVIEVEEFDRYMSMMSETEFQQAAIDSMSRHYSEWRKWWPGNTDYYVADVVEHEYYVSTENGYFIGLKPQTDYYFFAFCVSPEPIKPLGPIQKIRFTTPEYKPSEKGVDFDFMIRDTEESFYYFVRPSQQGKISFDIYFSTIFRDSYYDETSAYGGDIRAYLKDWLEMMGTDADYFLSIDISRFQTILDLEEGEHFTIVACPYVNLGNGPLTVRHFKYEKGMSTSYGHDEVIE